MALSSAIEAFTPRTLLSIRSVLHRPTPPQPLPAHTRSSSKSLKSPSESAVLIPLLNIDDRPHILMQVRAQKMRVHAGEVSFPGGKFDPTDRDLVHTALREAHEELLLPPDNVEMLGMLVPEYSLGNKTRVWPFVGFVHSTSEMKAIKKTNEDEPLPSFPLSTLRLSPEEVSALLPLPLDALGDVHRHSIHFFRFNTTRPYHRINVADLALPRIPSSSSRSQDCSGNFPDSAPESISSSDNLQVWGLSGWFLNQLAVKVGWLKPPIVPPLED